MQKKVQQAGGDFQNTVMKCTGTTTQKTALYSDALMSYASPQTGESVNIYKAANYSEDNPLYVIKGLDIDGNEFEETVEASKINSNNYSFNELMVLNVETGQTSPGDYNMVDNVLNNGAEKKENEQSKGRISIREKLAEKKAVIEKRDKAERNCPEKDTEKKVHREM